MQELLISEYLPALALRGLTVFPRMTLHFDVAREKSIKAVEAAMTRDRRIFLVTQRSLLDDDPDEKGLYTVGTISRIKQVLRIPGDMVRVLVEGETRAALTAMKQTEPHLFARVDSIPEVACEKHTAQIEALLRQSYQMFDDLIDLSQQKPPENILQMLVSSDPGFVADMIGQYTTFSFEKKQQILEKLPSVARLQLANKLLAAELKVLKIENELSEKVQKDIDKGQRDYYLREQLKVIRGELGDGEDDDEPDEYRSKIEALNCDDTVREKLRREVSRLAKQPFGSSEGAVIRNYLDVALELPWGKTTRETVDVEKARRILDTDHFGLEKVKERILETIAVRQLAPDMPAQIICLVGPPGVGKTSIAMSIARALNRKLSRISLGGIHDEAEIRGHRKTYIGAMPGRIINAVISAGSCNPLLLLDEIDKLCNDYRGDPASALLEVLDGEQNATFRDHFLEIPFDLSGCMFITTANNADTIPRALLDRMEVITLSSYTDEEKLMIAKNHLLPKQMKKHGLKKTQLRVTDDAIREIIQCYTRESGVRNLERELASVCRKTDMRLVAPEAPKRVTVTGSNIEDFLGPRKILPDALPVTDPVGLVTGLAWTAVGGETLEVECNVVDGCGKLELTGNLGDVMKESVHAAMSYIRSHCEKLHIAPDFYKTKDIHVHFPEGAVPKDGPSAGITVCTAMVSALSGATVRRDVAMTGEISIRGRVLPIGGLREKTMAALRHGVKTVIIPRANEKDLAEIDQTVRKALNFISVEDVTTVLETVLDFSGCEAAVVETKPAEDRPMPVAEQKPALNPGIRQ